MEYRNFGRTGVKVSPIIGPRTLEQLEDNLKALDLTITDDDRRRIDAVVPPGGMVSPYYETDFGPHTFT